MALFRFRRDKGVKLALNFGTEPGEATNQEMLKACALVLRDVMALRGVQTAKETKKEQKKRFLERLDKPSKNWKFEAGDLKSRALWDDYQKAYEDAINRTATKHCPWYVLPADDKWFTRYLVSEALVDVFDKIDPKYPELTAEQLAAFPGYKKALESES